MFHSAIVVRQVLAWIGPAFVAADPAARLSIQTLQNAFQHLIHSLKSKIKSEHTGHEKLSIINCLSPAIIIESNVSVFLIIYIIIALYLYSGI
jgi:hypothetical protein